MTGSLATQKDIQQQRCCCAPETTFSEPWREANLPWLSSQISQRRLTRSITPVSQKMHNMGFSKHFLRWILSYIGERRQFVQINDKTSELVDVQFKVPQSSILGPVLYNLYANDLNDIHDCTAFQYADDTTYIKHPSDLDSTVGELNSTMRALEGW